MTRANAPSKRPTGSSSSSEFVCLLASTHRVVRRSREERASTGVARPSQPTLCKACTQIAIDERIFREILPVGKADQMEQDFAKQQEAEKKASQKK